MNVTDFVQLWAEADTATNFFHNRISLVLGHRDAAKDSFIQFAARNDSDLQIKDTLTSFKPTLIPVKVYEYSGSSDVTICDFDSFDNSTESVGLPLGISATHILQKVIDSTNELQIILVINFSSAKSGIDKQLFTAQIRKISSWIRDIENYTNSIGLIVTNVANAAENQVLVEVNEILKHIELFFKQLQKENSENLSMVKLLNILLRKTKGSDYEKIGVFRQPSNQIPSNQMGLFQTEWLKVRNILNGTQFSLSGINDFNFYNQQATGIIENNLIRDIGKKLDEKIAKTIDIIFEQLQNEFEKEIHDDLEKAQIKLQRMNSINDIVQMTNGNIREVLLDLETKLKKLNIHLARSILEETLRLDNYLQFLLSADKNLKLYEWQKVTQKITNYIKSFHQWNDFLRQMDMVTSSYNVQKNSKKLQNDFITKPVTELNDERLQQFLKDYSDSKLSAAYTDIKGQKFSSLKILSLNNIFTSNLKPEIQSESDTSTGVNYIFGEYIILSDIISKFPNQKFLSINAANKIFIDTNIIRSDANFQMLSIISPVWEITGMQNVQINLDGQKGYTSIVSSWAGNYPAGRGDHGHEGHPGKSAGHFFGVADSLIHHGLNLSISANGGNGGNGTNGGNGGDGQEGDTAVTENCERKGDFDSYQREDLGGVIYHDYCVYGRHGGNGGQGGNGAVGAEGGFAGDIEFIALEKSSNIQISRMNGHKGEDGRGGAGGKAGKTGKSWKITKKTFWWAQPECNQASNDYCGAKNSVSKALNGTRGYDGYKRDTLQNPTKIEHPHWSNLLSTYRKYLLKYVPTGRTSEKKLTFLEKLNKNPSVIDLDTATGLADEFFYLVSQYQKATSANWVPHFEQLLYRTEHYLTKNHPGNDKEIAEMVQEAILAKIVFIKNQGSRILIVDLKKYLEIQRKTIEEYDFKLRAHEINSELWSMKDVMKSFVSDWDVDGNTKIMDNNVAEITNLINLTQAYFLHIFDKSYEQFENNMAVIQTLITMKDTFHFLRFVKDIGQKILDYTPSANKYFLSESESSLTLTAEIKSLVLQLTKNKLDSWKERFTPGLKDLIGNSTAVSVINYQLKQKYDTLLETETKNFYDTSKNIRDFVRKIVSLSGDMEIKEQKFILNLQKFWYLCESQFKNWQSLENHKSLNHALQIMGKGIVFSRVQQLSDNISDISESFLSNTLKTPQSIILDYSNLTNLLIELQILFHRIKKSFKLPLTDFLEHSFDALEAETKRMEIFYSDLAYYQEMRRLQEMARIRHNSGLILNDLSDSISLSFLKFLYKNIFLTSFYQLDFPFAYEDAKEVEISANIYQIFKTKASSAIDEIISKIQRGPIVDSVTRRKEVDLMYAQQQELYRWKGEKNKRIIKNLLQGKPVTLKADILKYNSYKQAIRINQIDFELQTENQTLQKELDSDLSNFGINLRHSGVSYYKCRDNVFTFIHIPLSMFYSFQRIGDSRVQRSDSYEKLKNSDYILSPFTNWRLSIEYINWEKIPSPFEVLKKYEHNTFNIDIVLKARSIYLRDNDHKKLPFVPNSSGDYCDSEAMRKYYKNDDIIFQMNSSEFAPEWDITDLKTSHRRKRSVGYSERTRFLSKKKAFTYGELNHFIDRNFSEYQIPLQQNKTPVLNIAGSRDYSESNLCFDFQYSLNDCLALLNLIIQRITNSRQTYSNFQDCAVNYSKVRQCSLEIIRKFEESLQVLSGNVEHEEYSFDPVLLMENLEQDIINRGGQNVNEILVNAVFPRKVPINESFLNRSWNKLGKYFQVWKKTGDLED